MRDSCPSSSCDTMRAMLTATTTRCETPLSLPKRASSPEWDSSVSPARSAQAIVVQGQVAGGASMRIDNGIAQLCARHAATTSPARDPDGAPARTTRPCRRRGLRRRVITTSPGEVTGEPQRQGSSCSMFVPCHQGVLSSWVPHERRCARRDSPGSRARVRDLQAATAGRFDRIRVVVYVADGDRSRPCSARTRCAGSHR